MKAARIRRPLAVVLVTAAAGLTACGGDAVPGSTSGQGSGSTSRSANSAAFPARAFAVPSGGLVVHRSAARTGRVVARLPARTAFGSPRVLLALAERAQWVEVALPTRPNGAIGWVPAADVRLEPVTMRIVVDLGTRRLRMLSGDAVLADTLVAVGSPADPTPRGSFYVTDRVRPSDPHGPYGAFALGLSAHSPTLTEFEGSDGQVAIHGTNDPGSIGRAVSHGCIRVPDSVAGLLAQVPLGTPVVVT